MLYYYLMNDPSRTIFEMDASKGIETIPSLAVVSEDYAKIERARRRSLEAEALVHHDFRNATLSDLRKIHSGYLEQKVRGHEDTITQRMINKISQLIEDRRRERREKKQKN